MLGVRSRATLYLVLIFLCGVLSGAVGVRWLQRMNVSADATATRLAQPRRGAVESFTRQLDLNPEQVQKLAKILDETRRAYRDHELEIESIKQHGRARIREILNAEQKEKFDLWLTERAAKEKEKEKREHR